MKTLVIKFGGAAFASIEQFPLIADLIINRYQEYKRLVVVVSAMGATTDQLIKMAYDVNPNPPQREYDLLISAGERISMTLLAMTLANKNYQAVSFTGSQSGIITCAQHSNAQIIGVRPYRLQEALDQQKIVIVAGFQGVSENREVTTLGRGGSDTSAVALALALNAEKVEFYKDVNGICDEDPKIYPLTTSHLSLSYETALEIVRKGARILHARAIELAAKNGLLLHVRSFLAFNESLGTLIYSPNRHRENNPLYEIP